MSVSGGGVGGSEVCLRSYRFCRLLPVQREPGRSELYIVLVWGFVKRFKSFSFRVYIVFSMQITECVYIFNLPFPLPLPIPAYLVMQNPILHILGFMGCYLRGLVLWPYTGVRSPPSPHPLRSLAYLMV